MTDIPIIDYDSLREKIKKNDVRVIDTRREDDYQHSHITNSVNLPLAKLLNDDSPESIARIAGDLGISDNTSVVVYDDTFGALSSRVVWALQYIGHNDVKLLNVTFSQWKDLGLDITTEVPEIEQSTHSINIQSNIMATADYLEKVKDNKNVVIIDNRERLNFLEQHIPGAINIPYRTLATDGKIIRTKESMRNLLKNRGISEDAEIITYCGSVGTLSGLAYYALKSIGVSNVKLYVHSFKEWKNLEKPIDKQENASYWDLSAE
jgi:thiosulfate/3-mercaptopyruvate sulfurtransferase|tara:strand:+ start:110 stop:901 length:792 start_codon:yes stop_codon:yes gene_type:complete